MRAWRQAIMARVSRDRNVLTELGATRKPLPHSLVVRRPFHPGRDGADDGVDTDSRFCCLQLAAFFDHEAYARLGRGY